MIPATGDRPTVPPMLRVDEIAEAESYQPGEPVWIYRYDEWLPGEVGSKSAVAVLVRYETAGGGSAVDTVLPPYVMRRGVPSSGQVPN